MNINEYYYKYYLFVLVRGVFGSVCSYLIWYLYTKIISNICMLEIFVLQMYYSPWLNTYTYNYTWVLPTSWSWWGCRWRFPRRGPPGPPSRPRCSPRWSCSPRTTSTTWVHSHPKWNQQNYCFGVTFLRLAGGLVQFIQDRMCQILLKYQSWIVCRRNNFETFT